MSESRRAASEAALRPVVNTVQPVVLSGGEWDRMVTQARMLVESGFLPPSLNTPQKAVAVALTGQELGIPMMLALRTIHIIDGKPTLSADLMASLVLREIDRHGDGQLLVLPPTPQSCTVRYRRWGHRDTLEYTYTIEDAARANLAGRATWKAHPAAMLRARAVSAVCRMAFPDVVAGLYTPDELLSDISVGELSGEDAAAIVAAVVEAGDPWPHDEDDDDEATVDPETGELIEADSDDDALYEPDPDADLWTMDREHLKADIDEHRKAPLGLRWADIMRHAHDQGLDVEKADHLVALARDVRRMRRELVGAEAGS